MSVLAAAFGVGVAAVFRLMLAGRRRAPGYAPTPDPAGRSFRFDLQRDAAQTVAGVRITIAAITPAQRTCISLGTVAYSVDDRPGASGRPAHQVVPVEKKRNQPTR